MTDDKDFKQLVREEARRSGRRYTEVRAEMRPGDPGADPSAPAFDPTEVATLFEATVDVIDSRLYGKRPTVRLVATALLASGNVLFTDVPGNGMTALAQGVAAAIGGHGVFIDGRSGFDGNEATNWRSGDVIVVSHFDGLDTAAQVAVIEARRLPAIVLAKRHPIEGRMPFPPDDDTRERFLFGLQLGYGDAETELRIVNEVRDGGAPAPLSAAIDLHDLAAMRAAVAAVDVPEEVRRFAVEAVACTRRDEALLLGASAVATLDLVRATAATAVAGGRGVATIEDARAILLPVLAHRVVFRPETGADITALVERVAATAAAAT